MSTLTPEKISEYKTKIISWQAKPDKLYKCKECGVTPVADEVVHGVKVEEDGKTKWAICKAKECVEKQLETLDLDAKKTFYGGAKSAPAKTLETAMQEIKILDEFLFKVGKDRAKLVYGKTLEEFLAEGDMQMVTQTSIFIQSWARTLIYPVE